MPGIAGSGMTGSGTMGASVSQGRGPAAPFVFFVPFVRRPRWVVAGITRDSTGVAIGGCTVDMFETATDIKVNSTVSDATGFYTLDGSQNIPYFLIAYKVGSPDLAGTTVNTLLGVLA